MAVRWTITFKTLKDRTGLVKVYDSTYSGDPIALEPAVEAFSTTRQQRDLFQPVVTDSGYLRIIDNGISEQAVEEIHPLGALDRPVEFYVDNVLKWRGYISPESFYMGWEPAPREIEFPLVGALNVLDSVTIQKNNTGTQPIAAFLEEILDATGFSWSSIVMATQMVTLDDGTSYDVPELRLGLSRFNFLNANKSDNVYDADWQPMEGETYLSVLSDICRYFCWTAIQDGDVLYLSTPRTDLDSYPQTVTWAALTAIAADPTAQPSGISGSTLRPIKSLSSLEWDGVNHKKSINSGYKKVTILTDLNNKDDKFPKLNFKGEVLNDWKDTFYNDEIQTGYRIVGHCLFLDPSKESAEFFQYKAQWDEQSQSYLMIPEDWTVPTTLKNEASGCVVRAFTYDYLTTDPDPLPKYKDFLRLRRRTNQGANADSNIVLAKLKSLSAGFYPAGGALFISASVYNQFIISVGSYIGTDFEGLTQTGAFLNNLTVRLKLGNKYFNGTSWQDFPTTFTMEVVGTSGQSSVFSGPGKIKNTNPGKYGDLEGFFIPIEDDMSGEMILDFFAWNDNSVAGSNLINTIFIGDLEIKYVNDYVKSDAFGVRLLSLTGTPFRDSLDVNLKLSSRTGIVQGLSLLMWNDSPIGEVDLFTYAESAGGREAYQPEYWLLDSLVKAYSKPSVWLELETEYDAALLMWSLIGSDSKNYLITGCYTDYASEHTKLIIASYE